MISIVPNTISLKKLEEYFSLYCDFIQNKIKASRNQLLNKTEQECYLKIHFDINRMDKVGFLTMSLEWMKKYERM